MLTDIIQEPPQSQALKRLHEVFLYVHKLKYILPWFFPLPLHTASPQQETILLAYWSTTAFLLRRQGGPWAFCPPTDQILCRSPRAVARLRAPPWGWWLVPGWPCCSCCCRKARSQQCLSSLPLRGGESSPAPQTGLPAHLCACRTLLINEDAICLLCHPALIDSLSLLPTGSLSPSSRHTETVSLQVKLMQICWLT